MKNVFIISLFILIITMINCSDDNPTDSTTIKKYPSKLNMEWEYNTQMKIEHYGDYRNVINTEIMDLGNTIVKIVKTNDTAGTITNLLKFESYDVQTSGNISSNWYSNSDSGLFIIAYSGAGATQLVIPKINGKRYLTFKEFIEIIKLPEPPIFQSVNISVSDSVYFYEVPRHVLAYPLRVNKRWVELVYPWYRERYVDKLTLVNFQGVTLACYIVKIDWDTFEIEFNDYINLNMGLIKREILADSVFFTGPNNPDSGSFGKISTYSELIRIAK